MALNMANKLPGGHFTKEKHKKTYDEPMGCTLSSCVDLCGPDFVSGSFGGVPDATPIGTAIETLRCKVGI